MNNLLPKINLILTLVLVLSVSVLGYLFYQLRGQVTLLNNNTPAISKTSAPNITTTTPPSGEDNNLSLSETNTFASKESLVELKTILINLLQPFQLLFPKKQQQLLKHPHRPPKPHIFLLVILTQQLPQVGSMCQAVKSISIL